ncbi:endosome-associated-trafficking regulator 1 isoform X2 [Eleginops maclovinus]|uniref:endosome-associated-trafficking regulator 1 isoform X2 n=1 Tax=Eleginops maclovinus TaxID=56733 RepID=UPI003080A323
MSKQRSCAKALIITDDKQADDLNPFSFREFLRWKNLEPEPDVESDLDQTHRQRLLEGVTFDPEARSCFLSESSLDPQEEEWGRSFQLGVESTSSLCTEEEEEEEEVEETRFSSRPEVQQGAGGGAEHYEGDDETSMAEAVSPCRRRSSQQEENQSLRRSIRELERSSQANQRRVEQLTEELLQRRHREEQEAQVLDSMVHSVEQNLTLMTKRAVRAELSVSKLKSELQQLQVEVDSLRSENEGLKAAESEVVMTMRQSAQVASEYLNQTASHAHSSIRQLLGGAETLSLVAQLLASIDRVSSEDAPG